MWSDRTWFIYGPGSIDLSSHSSLPLNLSLYQGIQMFLILSRCWRCWSLAFNWMQTQDVEQQQSDDTAAWFVRTADPAACRPPFGEQMAVRLPLGLAGPLPATPTPLRNADGHQRLRAPMPRSVRPTGQSPGRPGWLGIQMHRYAHRSIFPFFISHFVQFYLCFIKQNPAFSWKENYC